MFSHKRILICPLNWGLGHASRCIPVVRLLLQKNAEVIIAADGRPLDLLKKEFPQLEFVCLKGYNINYPDKGSMVLKLLFSLPKIFIGIYREHQAVKKIIQKKKINILISDNRFGCWNKKIRSIFITHQLAIKTPFAEKLVRRINLYFINKYDECWVPDLQGTNNLSGDLAHKYPLPENAFFIGTLSRFRDVIASEERTKQSHKISDCFAPIGALNDEENKYDILALISGPEPQRSIFETLVLEQIKQTGLKAIVILGKTELEQKTHRQGNIEIIPHMKTKEMQEAILNSKIIISRSGYSTIMDLAALGKKAIFVPTPGQTEQVYLADYLMSKIIAYCMPQDQFNLSIALKNAEGYTGFKVMEKEKGLEERIGKLIP